MVDAMTNDLAQHIWSHGEGELEERANWTDARAEAFVRKAATNDELSNVKYLPLHDVPESPAKS